MGAKETHWKQNFNYKYTGAYELNAGECKTVTISKTCREEVSSTKGDKQLCFIAYFQGSSKPMVLNKTNCKIIAKMYGSMIERWIGKQIIIEAKAVKAFGEVVEALRVKHTIPKAETINTKKLIMAIDDCIDMDELKAVYTAMTPAERSAMLKCKDAKKVKLSEVK